MSVPTTDPCPVCGSVDVIEIKCKVVCRNCGAILKSCADLERVGSTDGGQCAELLDYW